MLKIQIKSENLDLKVLRFFCFIFVLAPPIYILLKVDLLPTSNDIKKDENSKKLQRAKISQSLKLFVTFLLTPSFNA